jgi:ABC-type enterobactin transport system permease subunit
MPKPTRAQTRLGIAVLLCYAIGYPVALVVDSPVGWVFVTLGGIFLLLLGIVTVRRIHGTPPS